MTAGASKRRNSRRPILSAHTGKKDGVPAASSTANRTSSRIILSAFRSQGDGKMTTAQRQKAKELEQQKELRKSKRLPQKLRRVTRQQKKRVYNLAFGISDDQGRDEVKSYTPSKRQPKHTRKSSVQPLSSDRDDSESTPRIGKSPFTDAVFEPPKRSKRSSSKLNRKTTLTIKPTGWQPRKPAQDLGRRATPIKKSGNTSRPKTSKSKAKKKKNRGSSAQEEHKGSPSKNAPFNTTTGNSGKYDAPAIASALNQQVLSCR